MNCYQKKISNVIAFGAGLLVAAILPSKFVLVIASVTIIIVALLLCRR